MPTRARRAREYACIVQLALHLTWIFIAQVHEERKRPSAPEPKPVEAGVVH